MGLDYGFRSRKFQKERFHELIYEVLVINKQLSRGKMLWSLSTFTLHNIDVMLLKVVRVEG